MHQSCSLSFTCTAFSSLPLKWGGAKLLTIANYFSILYTPLIALSIKRSGKTNHSQFSECNINSSRVKFTYMSCTNSQCPFLRFTTKKTMSNDSGNVNYFNPLQYNSCCNTYTYSIIIYTFFFSFFIYHPSQLKQSHDFSTNVFAYL